MPPGTFVLLTLALLVAVAPYGLLFLAAVHRWSRVPRLEAVMLAGIVGLAGFCVFGALSSWISFAATLWLHFTLLGLGLLLVPSWWKGSRELGLSVEWRVPEAAVVGMVLAAIFVRLVPILIAGDTVGGSDAAFHGILAKKVLIDEGLSLTWAPVARVPVVYPRGVHVLCAFLAHLTAKPVEHAFNALIPLIGGLTTGVIYALARCLFMEQRPALLSAFAYAFLARWGSLDYFRWGGLPNALGMLFLCTLVWIVMSWMPVSAARPSEKRLWGAMGGLVFVAIYQVHHYSALVATMVLVFALLFTTPVLRARLARVLLTGLALALPVIAIRYLAFLDIVGKTNVLQFPEVPMTLWGGVRNLNPALVALFGLALLALRSTPWKGETVLVLAWATGLFVAFVSLEYLYRAGSLILSRGTEMFVAFTPSRMLTDMVYPMSVLCGGVTAWSPLKRWPRLARAALLTLGLATCAQVWFEQRHVGADPDVKATGLWLRANTPEDALVLGQEHYLAFFAWRECNFAPLPASEPRNHRDIVWSKEPHEPQVWREWSRSNARRVYSVLPSGESPPGFERRFSTPRLEIWELAGGS